MRGPREWTILLSSYGGAKVFLQNKADAGKPLIKGNNKNRQIQKLIRVLDSIPKILINLWNSITFQSYVQKILQATDSMCVVNHGTCSIGYSDAYYCHSY